MKQSIEWECDDWTLIAGATGSAIQRGTTAGRFGKSIGDVQRPLLDRSYLLPEPA